MSVHEQSIPKTSKSCVGRRQLGKERGGENAEAEDQRAEDALSYLVIGP